MTDKTNPGRFYVVKSKTDDARCLVEANTQSSALRRAALRYCTARPASASEIIEIMREGGDVIEVEKGTDLELPLEPVDEKIEAQREDLI